MAQRIDAYRKAADDRPVCADEGFDDLVTDDLAELGRLACADTGDASAGRQLALYEKDRRSVGEGSQRFGIVGVEYGKDADATAVGLFEHALRLFTCVKDSGWLVKALSDCGRDNRAKLRRLSVYDSIKK